MIQISANYKLYETHVIGNIQYSTTFTTGNFNQREIPNPEFCTKDNSSVIDKIPTCLPIVSFNTYPQHAIVCLLKQFIRKGM
jgi:hypothetical protein